MSECLKSTSLAIVCTATFAAAWVIVGITIELYMDWIVAVIAVLVACWATYRLAVNAIEGILVWRANRRHHP